MVKALRISDLNVELEETNMNQVQERFGGTFGTQGDAGDHLEWLCLSGRDVDGRWVLWLESGEMDAGTVGSFQWRRVPEGERFDARCGTLSDTDTPRSEVANWQSRQAAQTERRRGHL